MAQWFFLLFFFYFIQFKPKFYNKELIIWVTGNSRSYLYWLYSASPALAAKNIIIIIIYLFFLSWPPVDVHV